MAFSIKRMDADDSAATITRKDTPDISLRRVFRFWVRGEVQTRPIDDIVVKLQLSLLRANDLLSAHEQTDALDEILVRYLRRRGISEQHRRNDMRDMIVVLRLSLMRTLWEARGYLDLPYIDSVIRTTIRDFKNKHQTQIKKEYWGVLARECWVEIDHAARVEADQEREPVDIGDDDIDAWINSDFEE